jgi:hypothetical protein
MLTSLLRAPRRALTSSALLLFAVFAPASLLSAEDIPDSFAGKRHAPAVVVPPPELALFPYEIAERGLTGTTHYVSPEGDDAAAGTLEAPLRTLQAAADRTRPGDTVLVRGGTYSVDAEISQVDIRTSGTAENWIRYANYPGETPLIVFRSLRGFRVAGASYIVIEGFSFDGQSQHVDPAAATAHAESFTGEDHSQTHFFTTGIRLEGNDDTTNPVYPHHHIIRNNCFVHCAGGGIASARADYVLIERNTVAYSGYYSPWGTSGISIWQSANIIRDNLCYENDNKVRFWMIKKFSDGNGIIVDALATDQKIIKDGYAEPYNGRVLIANNLCIRNGGRGINLYESDHIDVYHNTLVENGTRPGVHSELEIGRVADCRVFNNIFASAADHRPITGYQSKAVTLSHNLFSGDRISDFPLGAKNLSTAPTFVAPLPPLAKTAAAVGFDPAVHDYRLAAGSVGLAAGSPAHALALDITGAARPAGQAPDLGAYQGAVKK